MPLYFPVLKNPSLVLVYCYMALLFSCESMKEYALEKDKEHEGKMTRRAVSDFWTFTTDRRSKKTVSADDKPRRDVFSIQDVSTRQRSRILADAEADLHLPEDTFQDRGFRLARHLLLDSGATAVRVRFWAQGCRRLCGVFAELTFSTDGKSFDEKKSSDDKTFRYTPGNRPWRRLTETQMETLQILESHLIEQEGRSGKNAMESALRATAADTGVPPAELKKLVSQSAGFFIQPAKGK